MLEIAALEVRHGESVTLRDLTLSVAAGEVLCLTGRNGAGKTTALRAVMGLIPATAGSIRLGGEELTTLPAHEVPRRGIGYVPQGRRLFREMTVRENLEIGRMARGTGPAAMEAALNLFPRLRERMGQVSGTLSGGEQQMLAMARALCLDPRLVLMDEPTEGLQPSMIAAIRTAVLRLKAEGRAVLLVEQRVEAVIALADRVAVMERGHIAEVIPAAALAADPRRLDRHVGVG